MFLLIWRGKGYLVPLAIIGGFALTALIGTGLGFQDATWQFGVLEFILTLVLFVPVWFYGKKHNVPLELIEKKTGREIVIKNPHAFFWIPIQYWAIIWPLIILLIFVFAR